MKPNEAVEFCEHIIDCSYCPIQIYGLDHRSRAAKQNGFVPCCENLIEHPDWHRDDLDWEQEWKGYEVEYKWRTDI